MDSLQGQLLIATPELLDPNFAQTVVLIAVHAEEGALGLIVNREASMSLEDIWSQVSSSPCLREGKVRQGGPITGTLMVVHDQRAMANLVINDDLYVATELNAMELLAGSDEGQATFYVGHSGWGPGQLETEVADGSWLVLPATPESVFDSLDTESAWKKAMADYGRRQVQSIVPDRLLPDDPRVN